MSNNCSGPCGTGTLEASLRRALFSLTSCSSSCPPPAPLGPLGTAGSRSILPDPWSQAPWSASRAGRCVLRTCALVVIKSNPCQENEADTPRKRQGKVLAILCILHSGRTSSEPKGPSPVGQFQVLTGVETGPPRTCALLLCSLPVFRLAMPVPWLSVPSWSPFLTRNLFHPR